MQTEFSKKLVAAIAILVLLAVAFYYFGLRQDSAGNTLKNFLSQFPGGEGVSDVSNALKVGDSVQNINQENAFDKVNPFSYKNPFC